MANDSDPDQDPPVDDNADSGVTGDVHDTSGDMHTDASSTGESEDTTQPQGESDPQGEGDVPGVTRPYTPEERMQQYMDQTKASRDSIDRLHAHTSPMYERYRNMLQEDQQMRQNPPQDQPLPPLPQQKKNDFLSAATQMLAVAVPIAMLFGVRGNGYAKGAMMSGIGSFMQNYAKGREQAAKDDMTRWTNQAQIIHASNQERTKIYKDILANHRLELDDQLKMINSVSKEFYDPTMAKASRTKDMSAIIKHLQNQEKADSRFVKGTGKVAKTLMPTEWADYRQYVLDHSNQKTDPDKDPVEAAKIITYSDWRHKYLHSKGEDTDETPEKPKEPSAEDIRNAAIFN